MAEKDTDNRQRSAFLDRMEIEGDFQLFFNEIERALHEGLWIAALYLIVALPDFCAAMESEDGKSTGEKYARWCDEHFEPGNEPLTGADRWSMRCKLLHQGTGEAKQYKKVSFLYMYNTANGRHRRRFGGANEDENIMLDPEELWQETRAAIHHWLGRLQRPQNCALLDRVVRQSILLLRQQGQVFSEGEDPEVVFAAGELTKVELIPRRQ